MSLILLPDLEPFKNVYHIHDDRGYIVWRVGTGLNVELLHIKATYKGAGRELLRAMLKALQSNPPYHTVFGFTRWGNEEAARFYPSCGFDCTVVSGVYRDGAAVVFSAPYEQLCKTLGVLV